MSRFIIVLEIDGEEMVVEIDPGHPRQFDIDVYLANEAVFCSPATPRGHPVTPAEAEHLAQLLGVEPTPKFRLDLHAAIASTLEIILRGGWKSPRWMMKDAARKSVSRHVRDALRGLVKRGEAGDDVRALFLEGLVATAHEHGGDLALPPHSGGGAERRSTLLRGGCLSCWPRTGG
jgi:hypothetical protein